MSYTRDREARRQRLKERGDLERGKRHTGNWRPKCPRCADAKQVVVQGEGLVPCPDCAPEK